MSIELWACSFRKIGRYGMMAPKPIQVTKLPADTTPSWSQLVRGAEAGAGICASVREVMGSFARPRFEGAAPAGALRMSRQGYHRGPGARSRGGGPAAAAPAPILRRGRRARPLHRRR